jgi:hypothetical protein
MDWLIRSGPKVAGVITATRGNHGQSVALAGRRAGVPVTILIPDGNSAEKNAAMAAFGAELIVCGRDFDEAKAHAMKLAEERRLHYLPSFHPLLVRGAATYALELFRAVAGLDTVYAPIGMGSGICGLIAVRDLLGLDTEIVGVVAAAAPAVALSVEARRPVPTDSAQTFADGMACREPHPEAVALIARGAAHRARRGGRDRRGDPALLGRHPQRRRGRGRRRPGRPHAGARAHARQARRTDPERRQHRHRRSAHRAAGADAGRIGFLACECGTYSRSGLGWATRYHA